MKPDKELKKEYKEIFSKNPDKYYPTRYLKATGFTRKQCKICKKFFWSIEKRDICGDSACIGRYDFLERKITPVKFTYEQVWKEFAKLFQSLGYKPLARYPVVARWRDDTLYVKASIYDFQPHVTSGNIPPPAKKIVIPQPCLRFNDVDNVGITMSHMTGFIMIGQHAFMPANEWSQEEVFKDICKWLFDILKIPKNEIVFHEDAWAGGGNLGPCIEYFSGGVELGNQVYTMYQMTEKGPANLKLKVLDMGMGMERVAWFTQGNKTIYDATFPLVLGKLFKATGFTPDEELLKRYVPFGALLNLDEIDDIEKNFSIIAKKLKTTPEKLKEFLGKISAIYSIAEHSRTLLFAISDGSLPSNVGDAYNLRILFRRAQKLIGQYKWKINLADVCEWHCEELKNLFPELKENIADVKKIIGVELLKYAATQEKTNAVIEQIKASKKKLNVNDLIELYDNKGIHPDMLTANGLKITVPKDFYSLVAQKHESEAKKQEEKHVLSIEGIEATKILYYTENPMIFSAKIAGILKGEKDSVILLDRTNFYPKSGGQDYDLGKINDTNVIRVEKQGDYVLHFVDNISLLKKGQAVECKIDIARRKQLSIHHTATHIVNGAARHVLGNHVYQAGASKTVEKSRLDITHYQPLNILEIKKIEDFANKISASGLKVKTQVLPRNVAEEKYGFRIYQGGYVPGKEIRIVEIENFDVEACGGTHLNNTSETGEIKILRSAKIHDGIIRIEFVAGDAAKKYVKKKVKIVMHFKNKDDLLKAVQIFKVPEEQLKATIERFSDESKAKLERLNKILVQLNEKPEIIEIPLVDDSSSAAKLFDVWKELDKKIFEQEKKLVEHIRLTIKDGAVFLTQLSPNAMRILAGNFKRIILLNKEGFFIFRGSDAEYSRFEQLGAKGGGADIKQGKYPGKPEDLNKIF